MAINAIWNNHHSNCASAMTDMAITHDSTPIDAFVYSIVNICM
jgi:hypothetical protein